MKFTVPSSFQFQVTNLDDKGHVQEFFGGQYWTD